MQLYRITLFVVVLAVICGACLTTSAFAQPKIRFSEEIFDFGYTPEGLKAQHRYWLANDGDETLLIQRVRPTCGCTTVPLPTDRISPGDSVPLDLVFDTQKFKGKVHKSVRIESNEKIRNDSTTTNQRKIYFTAHVGGKDEFVTVEPVSAYLDTIGKFEQAIEIINNSDTTVNVRITSPPPSFMTLEFPAYVVPANGRLVGILRAGEKTPIGEYTGSLTLELAGARRFSVTVPIYGVGYRR